MTMIEINEYWVDDDGNMWTKARYTLQQAKEYSQSLNLCRGCVDCRECDRCVNCVDCIHCTLCEHSAHLQHCNGCVHCKTMYQCTNMCYCTACTGCRACYHSNKLTNCKRCVSCDSLTGVTSNPERVYASTPSHVDITMYNTNDGLVAVIDKFAFKVDKNYKMYKAVRVLGVGCDFRKVFASILCMKYGSSDEHSKAWHRYLGWHVD